MTTVMFTRLVRSRAQAEDSTVARQALAVSGIIGVITAILCTIFPELPLRILSPRAYWSAAWLVPWFAWGMLPLALSYVLVNNLLAQARYAVVPAVVVLAVAYGITLTLRHETFLQVVQTFCFFSALQFVTCLGFTWYANRRRGQQ